MRAIILFILFEIILLCQVNAQNIDRSITKDPDIELISRSEGITNIPYYLWSRYSNTWIVKKNGGVSDNTNFDTLSISKYKTNNKIYYAFFIIHIIHIF